MALQDFFVVKEDAIRTPIAALINDDLPEGVTIVAVSAAANGAVELTNGEIFYSPVQDFIGADSFTYTLSNGNSATVTIDVARSHEQPHADVENWRSDLIDTPEDRAVLAAQLDDMAAELSPSGLNLVVSRFAKLPGAPAMDDMVHRGGNLYVVAQATTGTFADNDGKIFEIARDAATGETSVSEFLDIGQLIRDLPDAVGLDITMNGGRGNGPRSMAFHPGFDDPDSDGYGKLYIAMVATADPEMDPASFLSTPTIGNGAVFHNVTFEVTYDFDTGRFPAETYREVIRDQPTVRQHPVRDIGFDPYAQPGDADYGLLYIIHGDGEPNGASIDRMAGQLNNGSGKLLRIDPLQNGEDAYSVPASNPFVGDPGMLDEVFALGLRNEHTMSFAIDPGTGKSVVVLTGIGFSNIDEINIVRAGDNLGWALREGHFISDQIASNVTSLSPLPAEEWALGLTYPVAFIAHDAPVGQAGDVGQALAGGHVISNGSALDGQYVFADFASSSRAFHISSEDMFAARTQLSPGEDPSALSWVTPSEAVILFNHDNDPETTPIALNSFKELVGNASRSDVRFGEGAHGELYIMNKFDGWIYIVENSAPPGFVLPGGFEVTEKEIAEFDAVSDAYVINADLDVLNIFAFGGPRGVIENDSNPGLEPIITAVNGAPMPFVNADNQPEAAVRGSNGGIFTVAQNGQMSFTPGDDFDDLGAGQSRVSSLRYTLKNEFGETDVAEIFVTVRGDATIALEIDFVSSKGRPTTGTLVPNSTTAFTNSAWTVTDAPQALIGADTIPLFNGASALALGQVVRSFTLNADGYVYVALNADQKILPGWIGAQEWTATGEVLSIANGDESRDLAIYGRKYAAGELVEIFGPDSGATDAEFNSIVMVSDIALFEADGGRITFGGKQYMIAGTGQTWAEAQATAAALGGTLVEPDTAAENAFLVETFGTKGPIWLDLSDAANEGVWVNSAGEAASYTNWLPGNPDDAGASQNYARIASATGQWDDAGPGAQGMFVDGVFTPRDALTIVEIPVEDQTIRFGDSTYRLGTAGLTWQQAQAEAQALGGRLVEINSAAENAFILQTFWNNAPIWLGWNDVASEGDFVGTDSAIDYENWQPGNPDDIGNQDYVRIADASGKWDDSGNSATGILLNGVWTPTGTTTTVIEFDNSAMEYEFAFGNSYYEFAGRGLNIDQARAAAEAAGGKLLTVESQAENDFIMDSFWTNDGRIWLDINDVGTEGTWVDQNGDVIFIKDAGAVGGAYTNWFRNQPDNFSGTGATQQADYGSIAEAGGGWDDTWFGGGAFFNGDAWVNGQSITIIEHSISPVSAIAQGGTVTTSQAGANQWHTVTFAEAMEAPIVVMGPVSNKGQQAAFTRVRDVTSEGFQFQIDEWRYDDGRHITETITWMAVEAGVHDLGGGRVIEAGAVTANTVQTGQAFNAEFSAAPAIFGQVASDAGSDPVVARFDDVDANGFDYLFQEDEKSFLGPVNAPVSSAGFADYTPFNALFPTPDAREFGFHFDEEFHFIALSDGDYGVFAVGTSDGIQSDTHQPFAIDYVVSDFDPTGLLLQTTSMNAYNPATGRLISVGDTEAEVFFQEETSYDPETQRLFGDSYAWVVTAGSFVLFDDGTFA